jgi:hypothetical protein
MRRRFGVRVPPDVEQRVTTATIEQMDVWADRLLTSTTLAALFAD